VPTYNNAKTLSNVISGILEYTHHLIVVNDGSDHETATILSQFEKTITIVTHSRNLGKGMALRNGFSKARSMGYHYAITLDSDGQHFPSDLEQFLLKLDHHPGSLIVGARNMDSENVPNKSSFGNKFSNFWFRFETGINLPDTQSGYRLYPIKKLEKIKFFTTRFEFEIEVLVKSAWKGIPVLSLPVQVFYAKGEERVTHFRPGKDFTRISILNTWLVLLALAWYKPMRLFKGLTPTNINGFIRKHFLDKEESVLKKSLSASVGIFFGIVPIWGYQLISAIAAAYFFKLNKAIVILTANISIPPLLPFVLLGSLKTGELVTGNKATLSLSEVSLDTVKQNLYTYLVGACVLAIVLSLITGVITAIVLTFSRKRSAVKR
jgi:glycosyltransferase involved in cell wall biosynthesis